MSSGIDGPGSMKASKSSNEENPEETSQEALSILPSSTLPPSTSSSQLQGQFYIGEDDDNAQEKEGIDLPTKPSNLPENHLSFADLMAHQNKENLQAATDARGISACPPGGARRDLLLSDAYNPLLHASTSLDEEIEKVFKDDTSAREPSQLRIDFANPAAVVDSPARLLEQKYGEHDFSSHRRESVHMYQPMATHLSSRDLKTIQSAQSTKSLQLKRLKVQKHPSSESSLPAVSKSSSSHRSKSKSGKENKKVEVTRPYISEKKEGRDGKKDVSIITGNEGGDKNTAGDVKEAEFNSLSMPGKQQTRQRGPAVTSNQSTVHFVQNAIGKVSTGAESAVVFSVGTDAALRPTTGLPDFGEAGVLSSTPNSRISIHSSSSSCSSVSESEGKAKPTSAVKLESEVDGKFKKKHKHRHRRKKGSSTRLQRRMSGLKLKALEEEKALKLAVEEDGLEKVDIEEIKSHRYEDMAGVRKHLLHRPVKVRKLRTELEERKVHDRKPHEVFVELDELVHGEWKETARWIKFEEDVEESQMWGKPRIASLSFHSLLELRKTIEKGAVMLDVELETVPEIANAVVGEMVATGQIRGEDQGNVLRALLSKHKHRALETGLPYNLSRASFSNFFNQSHSTSRLNSVASDPEVGIPLLDTTDASDVENGDAPHKAGSPPPVSFSPGPSAKDIKIMRKIPEGAEATAVLVGNMDHLEQPTMAFVRLASGADLDDVVALPIPVRFLFILLGPSKPDYDYHEIGRSISTLMADREFRVMAYAAENRGDLLRAINEFLDDSIVLPPGQLENPDLLKNITKYQSLLAQRQKKKRKAIEDKDGAHAPPLKEEDPLQRTKRCFGGLIADVRRRYPLYRSDITDAFNLQCLASVIFIYFAALSPAITFGGLLGEKTNGFIGVSEMILGCCVSGCLFGLLSGQPLLVVGSTGPLIVFEEAVYSFANGTGLPYLASRFWIGLWICIICVVVVAFEGSFLVRYVTRFTQEIFSVLISLIFIFETFSKLARIYADHPLKATYPVPINETALSIQHNCSFQSNQTGPNGSFIDRSDSAELFNQPNTALLSTLLMFGTFIIAYFLRQFKNSKFFRSSVRRTIGDFGVPIAIIAMLVVDILITDTYTQKLNVPRGISPTDPSKRGWLISPLGSPDKPLPVWMVFGAVVPAFLVFILIFMESHITEIIISAKERNLKKGTGFHLNLLVLGVLNLVLSCFGMPWVCCAAVRSITHTNSLTIMSTTQAPGEKPHIEGLREQRVTVFVVNACLGLSILMQPLLKEIPLAVLFGIFLYMGVTSLSGVQFVDRLQMLFMPAKHYPDFSYVKAVRRLQIHLFTLIETVCLAILWAVKSTVISIGFPFALVLTVPLRFFVLPRIFTKKDLFQLDNEDSNPSVTSSNRDECSVANVPD